MLVRIKEISCSNLSVKSFGLGLKIVVPSGVNRIDPENDSKIKLQVNIL